MYYLIADNKRRRNVFRVDRWEFLCGGLILETRDWRLEIRQNVVASANFSVSLKPTASKPKRCLNTNRPGWFRWGQVGPGRSRYPETTDFTTSRNVSPHHPVPIPSRVHSRLLAGQTDAGMCYPAGQCRWSLRHAGRTNRHAIVC